MGLARLQIQRHHRHAHAARNQRADRLVPADARADAPRHAHRLGGLLEHAADAVVTVQFDLLERQQLRVVQRFALGQHMLAWHHGGQLAMPVRKHLQAVMPEVRPRRHVRLPFQHGAKGGLRCVFLQQDVDLGVRPAKRLNPRGQVAGQRRHADRQAHAPPHPPRKSRHLAVHVFQVLQQPPHVRGQRVAGRGGLHALDAALQQRHAKRFLHFRHALADRRRHDVLARGGPRQAAFFQGG
ncbi:hypothetical protein D3C87_1509980 [compost metagenome]